MDPNVFLLYVLIFVHILIWLFVFFAGFIHPVLCKIILLVALPVLFIAQSFPNHVLMFLKLNLIRDHLHKNFAFDFTPTDYCDMQQYSNKNKVPLQDVIDGMITLKYYEHFSILPVIIDKLKYMFRNSFRNPFDAQGMIILAFIINVFLYVFKSS